MVFMMLQSAPWSGLWDREWKANHLEMGSEK